MNIERTEELNVKRLGNPLPVIDFGRTFTQQNSDRACVGALLTTHVLDAYNSLLFVSDDGKSQLPLAGSTEYDTTGSGVQDPASGGPRGPGSHDQIPPNKPPWFDQPHPVAPWGQQQVRNIVLKRDVEGGGSSEGPLWMWK